MLRARSRSSLLEVRYCIVQQRMSLDHVEHQAVVLTIHRCRRNDVSRAQPIQELHSPSILPTAASYFDPPPMDIVPQRSPTMARPLSLSSDLSLSDYEYMQGDHSSGYPSEALRFLSQFHSHDYSIDQPSRPKPRPNRTSTATESSSIPSLINTPSSSYGTAGSQSSYGYRPLPPRHDPLTGHRHTKSTDLVIPMFSAPASASPDQASMNSSVSTLTATKPSGTDEIDFARQSRRQRRSETASGSLKKLFSHEAMQASPCDR